MKTTLLNIHVDRVAFLGLDKKDFYISTSDSGSVLFKIKPHLNKEAVDIESYTSCSLLIKKPDGLYVLEEATPNLLDGTFDVELSQQSKMIKGQHTAKVILISGSSISNSPYFIYEVVGDDMVDAPNSENFSTQLARLFDDFEGLEAEIENIFGDLSLMQNLVDDVSDLQAEALRLEQDKLDKFTLVWYTPTLENGWTSNAGTIIQYAKDPFGFVYIRGWMANGTNGTKVFTLPEGFRPSQPTRLPTAYSGYVRINANGDVIQEAGSTVSSPLDPIRFMSA